MPSPARILLMKELYKLTKEEALPTPINVSNRDYSYTTGMPYLDREVTEREVAEHVIDFQLAMEHQSYEAADEEYLWLKHVYQWR